MGQVIIFPETTRKPITLIGRRAGVCWGSDTSDDTKNYERGLNCIKQNHGRTLEFVDVQMCLKGYSARVIREWYTHIGGSPTRLQESTRYKKYDDFNLIVPKSIESNSGAYSLYMNTYKIIQSCLMNLEKEFSIPREDAAMILPLGMATTTVDKRNVRNLIDMSRNRECATANWEYRNMFSDLKKALAEYGKDYGDEWTTLINMTFHPKCVELRYCPEDKCCGRYPKKEELWTLGVDLANE